MIRGKSELRRLVRAAMGEVKSELIVTGGKLVNVYSGEILEGFEIAVSGGRICYVGPSAKHTRNEATEVVDADGLYVAPGFIDAHTHIGHYARPFENLQSFLPHGTTAVVASCDELSTVFGFSGFRWFLDEVERHPLRVYTLMSMVAPQDPLLCNTATLSPDEIVQGLADPRVAGLGEIVSWLRLLECDEALLESIEAAHRRRQIIHGHTAGARDRKLCAVAATGISSCHEPIRVEDALERLRLGYWTMLREGSLRQDLEATLGPLLERGVSLQRLILVTDSMAPDDVGELGHMNHVVRRAISLGMTPMAAIQAVTVNPATYSGIEQDVGGIAPGRYADLALLADLEGCEVKRVLIGGQTVAQDGASLTSSVEISSGSEILHSLGLRPTVTPERFRLATPKVEAQVRVIEWLNQTITAERVLRLPSKGGLLPADSSRDLLKIAMFDRHHGRLEPALGLVRGFGARVGAVGLTANLDENTLMILGSSDTDMAVCANALIEAGGGIAIVDGGAVLDKLDFPAGGIFSLEPWQTVGKGLRRIHSRLKEMGSSFDKPIFALTFLPFVTLPALRITSRGLINVKERRIVPLWVDEGS